MKACIHWFAHNPVAANLIMVSIFILGLMAVMDTRKELIPNVSLQRISIQTAMPGATVDTVEINVCKPIEDRIYDIQGTLDLLSIAHQGLCSITLDVAEGFDILSVMDEVKSRLQNKNILPKDALSPQIKELNVRNRVAKLILSGNVDFETLTKTARQIRRELLDSKKITVIDLEDVKKSEIRIEISSFNLNKYQVNFQQVGGIINRQSVSLAGGTLKSASGEILIVAGDSPETVSAYEDMSIYSNKLGADVSLGDIAHIRDNRVENTTQANFNQFPALSMDIYRVGSQNIMSIAKVLSNYVQQKTLPEGLILSVWQDDSKHFSSRIKLLLSNALGGLFLLFIVLLLFMNFHLSFWVSLGIPISFFGSLMMLPIFDVSINIISLFAFILVLGIVVDDAVVVGESIHGKNQQGITGIQGSLAGVYEVYKPVLFAIATSIVAFLPLLFLPGPEGKLMMAIPIVVISTLLFSLFESLFILPAHLSKEVAPVKINPLTKLQSAFSQRLQWFIDTVYQPLLLKSLKKSGLVIVLFSMIFVLFMVVLFGGWLKTSLFAAIEGDVVVAQVIFADGTPRETTRAAVDKLRQSAQVMKRQPENGQASAIEHIYSVIGPKNKVSNLDVEQDLDHLATVTLALNSDEGRQISGQQIINRWRSLTGVIDGAREINFNASLNPAKADINIEFSGHDLVVLEQLAEQLKQKLASYEGIHDIKDSMLAGKQQARLVLKSGSKALDITLDQIIKQVNLGFEGKVVQSIQTQDDEVDIWLGLPKSEQASLWYLENLPIEVPGKKNVSLSSLVDIEYYQSKSTIRRYDRKRVISVSAYVNTSLNSVARVQHNLTHEYLDNLIHGHSGVSWNTGGQQKSIAMFLEVLSKSYLIAILAMYLMMAILFSSYSQPLLVLFAIPFGLVGSLVGHMMLGLDLTLWSFVGMVAVSGVVVNDNLVLLDFINTRRHQGMDIYQAVCEAGKNRFRPILLTSLTTFMGLVPLIMESSIQAQFLIPMAVSLAFGVLFATVISLILVPASFLMLESMQTRARRFKRGMGSAQNSQDTVEEAYSLGLEKGNQGRKNTSNPYEDEVLHSSWEAGWADAKHANIKPLNTEPS